MINGRLLLATPALCVLLAVGCDAPTNTPSSVSGKVTYNGKPLPGGTIRFTFKEGGAYSGVIEPDGSYTANQLPAGDAKVSVETDSLKTGSADPKTYQGGRGGSQMMSPVPSGRSSVGPKGEYTKIPEKYKDPDKSGFTVTVGKGSNSGKNFDLVD
jgi:hypothetical protein